MARNFVAHRIDAHCDALLPSIMTVLISRVTLNLRITVYGAPRISRRTYKDIVLSDFETKSDIDTPTVNLSVTPFGRSSYSCSDIRNNNSHIKSELVWTRCTRSDGVGMRMSGEGYVPKSRSPASSDGEEEEEDEDDGVDAKAYSRSTVADHDMVREVPRGRSVEDGGGSY